MSVNPILKKPLKYFPNKRLFGLLSDGAVSGHLGALTKALNFSDRTNIKKIMHIFACQGILSLP